MDYGQFPDEAPLLEDFGRCTDLENGALELCQGSTECRHEGRCNSPPS
jgi:hypothetical protein